MNSTDPTRGSTSEFANLLSAVYAIFHAVEQLEQVCEDLIDCNDVRLMQARGDLSRAQDTLTGLGG